MRTSHPEYGIFAHHGYPWLIHRPACRRSGHSHLHVRGHNMEISQTGPGTAEQALLEGTFGPVRRAPQPLRSTFPARDIDDATKDIENPEHHPWKG
ncbi:hypothetical protein AB0D14_37900 [Streptomyces sp. NPDC048484]|uniref:phosphoketolase family protein n=1 Tax=Streptomyces sp. NPDC048484 TaxID=3155146 RepID=UPI003447CF04